MKINLSIFLSRSSPLTIGMSLYFLWGYLGVSSLAGLGVMVVLIPINAILSSRLKKYQFGNMKTKGGKTESFMLIELVNNSTQNQIQDKRIRVMNEILEGIQVLKLYAWEPSFAKKVMKIREEEVEKLQEILVLQSDKIQFYFPLRCSL